MKIGHRRPWKWSFIEWIQALSVPGLSSCQPARSKRVREYQSFEATLFQGKSTNKIAPKLMLYCSLYYLIFIPYKSLTFKDIFETLGETGYFWEWNFGQNTDWNSWKIAVCSIEKNWPQKLKYSYKKMVGTTFSFVSLARTLF